MLSCLMYFCESGFTGRSLQKLVDRDFPGFACEREVCSTFSPGVVEADEKVAFILINPTHYDPIRNVVVPEAFQELTNRDLSVLRIKYITRDELEKTKRDLIERGKDYVPPKVRFVEEVCIASASDIRAGATDGDRLFGVYDTALEDVPSHASVFTISEVLDQRRLRKVARNRIHALFTKQRIPFQELLGQVLVAA